MATGTTLQDIDQSIRIWHPAVNRDVYASEKLRYDKEVRVAPQGERPTQEFTWLAGGGGSGDISLDESANPNVVRMGGAGTSWLDPMVNPASEPYLRTACIDGNTVLPTLPTLPYSNCLSRLGTTLRVVDTRGYFMDRMDLIGAHPPPAGARVLNGGDKYEPATEWFTHGNRTARTGSQWADPDRAKVGSSLARPSCGSSYKSTVVVVAVGVIVAV